jgi:hypothetical protein
VPSCVRGRVAAACGGWPRLRLRPPWQAAPRPGQPPAGKAPPLAAPCPASCLKGGLSWLLLGVARAFGFWVCVWCARPHAHDVCDNPLSSVGRLVDRPQMRGSQRPGWQGTGATAPGRLETEEGGGCGGQGRGPGRCGLQLPAVVAGAAAAVAPAAHRPTTRHSQHLQTTAATASQASLCLPPRQGGALVQPAAWRASQGWALWLLDPLVGPSAVLFGGGLVSAPGSDEPGCIAVRRMIGHGVIRRPA